MEGEPSANPPPPLPPPPPPPLPPPAALQAAFASLQTPPNKTDASAKTGQRSLSTPRAPPVSFGDKERPAVEDLREMGVTKAMRALDALRRHIATETESEVLGAIGRLDVQDQAGVLTLCGCQRGGRLTSDEMKTVQRVTCGMAGASARLETLFETLAPKIRASCATTKQDVEDELEIFFVAAGEWLTMYNEMRALVVTKNAELALSSTDSEVLVLRALAAASATMSEDASKNPDTDGSQPFPAWLSILMERYRIEQEGHLDASSGRRSPNLTPAKDRATPPKNEPIVSGGTLPTIGGVKDQESMQQPAQVSDNASPIQRVQDGSGSHLTLEAATVAIPTATCVESLARFSRFLALLVVTPEEDANTLATTDREREALEELLRASDDGSDREAARNVSPQQQTDSDSTRRGNGELGSPPPAISSRTLRYWARRIHRFLLSVRELKAVPDHDEDSLDKIFAEASMWRGRWREQTPPSPARMGGRRSLSYSPRKCAGGDRVGAGGCLA